MTLRIVRLTAALIGLGLATMSARAWAQSDVNPPLPNVMLLVDTSGSMEYTPGTKQFPVCDPTGTDSERSRWIEAVEVLTGTISDYRCNSVNRSSTAFRDEYSLAGNLPPDFQYNLPYHRPLSGTCTPGPGVLPSPNAYDYPSGAIRYHAYDSLSTPCTTFSQANDGILDNFLTLARFGLMTYDTSPNAATGVSGTAPDYPNGIKGTWSYYVGSAKQGHFAACTTMSDQEVGARNAAAPPWEGRMVAFGDPAANTAATTAKNQQIQEILLTTRPYDATPTAGMLDDARAFFWYDNSNDPLNSALRFGPNQDPFVQKGCRSESIILLTDGEPNEDLRPSIDDSITPASSCEGAGPPAGVCPYDKPEDITFSLANPPSSFTAIKTYVIGFALSNVTVNNNTVDCTALTDDDLTKQTGLCLQNPNNVPLQACCSLNRIAFNGGTGRAFFVSDKATLREALSAALSKQMSVTSRTFPVFASGSSLQSSFAASFRFFSSFKPLSDKPWQGVLERQRVICQKDANTGQVSPVLQPIDSLVGDDFVANVNSGSGTGRNFISVTGDVDNGAIHSDRSIRPALTSNVDGAGVYNGTQYSDSNVSFVTDTPPAAMALADGSCGAGKTAMQCRDLILRWDVGLDNGTEFNRCAAAGASDCNLVGDIYHSTPRVVNRPINTVRDEAYESFTATAQNRPLVLYTSTNDGFLHAFKVAPNDPNDSPVNSKANNELWAFIPPATLPSIQSEYPPAHANLLDGVPVVRDVIARPSGNTFILDRTLTSARNGTGTYRTVLVQGFGSLKAGYFALDITNPVIDQSGNGPKFLWQLTTDATGAPLFGGSSTTPAITTLFFDVGNSDIREVPVAILPGGSGGSPTGASCARGQTSFSIQTGYAPRTNVNCYPSTNIAGRSLTIVRLDTGEIIRTFRRSTTEAPAGLSSRVNVAQLDSPITGEPVPYPAGIGVVSDRVYVGDADGAIWKADLSSTNPANWTMSLFFDAYPTSLGHTFNSGEPIDTPPIVSVDDLGNPTLAVSTGDQEIFANSTMTNYVWSLSDEPDSTGTALMAKVHWYKSFASGERVAGPMSLFNGSLFFSTFLPASVTAGACTVGSSTLWGMHYLRPKDNTVSAGGADALPDPSTTAKDLVQKLDVTSLLSAPNATIFGVGVAQLPTCSEVDTSFSDPFLGYGTHTSIKNVNPGKFQLVVQTGSGGTAVAGGQTHVSTIDLESPAVLANIDSWASVIE